MVVSVELVTAVGTTLTSLLGGIAVLLANRSRRMSEDTRSLRRAARQLQKRFLAAMDHIYVLEEALIHARRHVPDRPAILEADDDDDEPPTPQPASARAPA